MSSSKTIGRCGHFGFGKIDCGMTHFGICLSDQLELKFRKAQSKLNSCKERLNISTVKTTSLTEVELIRNIE